MNKKQPLKVDHVKVREFISNLPRFPDVADIKQLIAVKKSAVEIRRLLARKTMGV